MGCTEVARVALNQGRRHEPLLQQALGAIDIGHQAVQHAHALLHAGFNLLPAFRCDDQGEQVQ